MSTNSGVTITTTTYATPSSISREKVSKFITYMYGVNALTYRYTSRAELSELLSDAIATAFKFHQSLDALKKKIYDFVGEDPLFTQTHQLIKVISSVHLNTAWNVSPDVMATNIRVALAPLLDNRDAVMDAAARLRDVYRTAYDVINAAATALEANANAPTLDYLLSLPPLPSGLHVMNAGASTHATSTPTAAPSETPEIAQLVDMGFNSTQAAAIISAAGGNVENALDMILG